MLSQLGKTEKKGFLKYEYLAKSESALKQEERLTMWR